MLVRPGALAVLVALLVVAVAACGGGSDSPGSSGVASSAPAPSEERSPRPAASPVVVPSAVASPAEASSPATPANALPAPVAGQLVTCGFGGFPAADLEAVGEDQDDDDPAAAALRTYIAGARPVADWIPERGYFEVLRTPDLVLWVNRNTDGPVQGVAEQTDGTWSATVAGCQQPEAVTQGTVPVIWALASEPDPAATEVDVLAASRECSGGVATGDRLRPPEVVETDESVTITFVADPLPPGSYGCPGTQPTPITVQLAAPAGDRALLDGGTIPPEPVGIGEGGLYR